jgi:hypothetical protein
VAPLYLPFVGPTSIAIAGLSNEQEFSAILAHVAGSANITSWKSFQPLDNTLKTT